MSVTWKTERFESWGGECGGPQSLELAPSVAVIKMLGFSLGWGGRVEEVREDYIRIRAFVMGRYDICEFSGTADEMSLLLEALGYWVGAWKRGREQFIQVLAGVATKAKLNKPFQLNMLAGLAGLSRIFPVLCMLAGLDEEQAAHLNAFLSERAKAQHEQHKKLGGYYTPSIQSLRSDMQDPIFELLLDGNSLNEVLEVAA